MTVPLRAKKARAANPTSPGCLTSGRIHLSKNKGFMGILQLELFLGAMFLSNSSLGVGMGVQISQQAPEDPQVGVTRGPQVSLYLAKSGCNSRPLFFQRQYAKEICLFTFYKTQKNGFKQLLLSCYNYLFSNTPAGDCSVFLSCTPFSHK